MLSARSTLSAHALELLRYKRVTKSGSHRKLISHPTRSLTWFRVHPHFLIRKLATIMLVYVSVCMFDLISLFIVMPVFVLIFMLHFGLVFFSIMLVFVLACMLVSVYHNGVFFVLMCIKGFFFFC